MTKNNDPLPVDNPQFHMNKDGSKITQIGRDSDILIRIGIFRMVSIIVVIFTTCVLAYSSLDTRIMHVDKNRVSDNVALQKKIDDNYRHLSTRLDRVLENINLKPVISNVPMETLKENTKKK